MKMTIAGTGYVGLLNAGKMEFDPNFHESLLEAGQFTASIENRHGLKVACPEEIAFRLKWINAAELESHAQPLAKNGYGQYLLGLLKEKVF